MGDKIKFNIPGKPAYLQTVRLALGSIATSAGFDVDKVSDIQIAIEEACKVVVCHGQASSCESYEIEVEIFDEKMEISVTDFDRKRVNKAGERFIFCVRCPEEGDMGMIVIETLMDSCETEVKEDGSKKIIMVKNK